MPFDNSPFVLALVVLLTACVTEAPSVVPITAPSPAEVVGKQLAIADGAAVQKSIPIFCMNRKTFERAVQNERLSFYGVIPTAATIIVEIYSAKPGETGFTIAIRDATQDEVCIILAGSELVPVSLTTAS